MRSPYLNRLSTFPDQPMTNMVLDVPPLSYAAKEWVGHRRRNGSQKPLDLLERLVKATSST